jgi:hypothetical protein
LVCLLYRRCFEGPYNSNTLIMNICSSQVHRRIQEFQLGVGKVERRRLQTEMRKAPMVGVYGRGFHASYKAKGRCALPILTVRLDGCFFFTRLHGPPRRPVTTDLCAPSLDGGHYNFEGEASLREPPMAVPGWVWEAMSPQIAGSGGCGPWSFLIFDENL